MLIRGRRWRTQNSIPAPRSSIISGLVVLFCAGWIPAAIWAQSIPTSMSTNSMKQASGTPVQTPTLSTPGSSSLATLEGVVQDARGAAVPGAEVTIVDLTDAIRHVERADRGGNFKFENLASGTYRMTAEAPGLTASASAPITLGNGEQRQVTLVATNIPVKNTTVEVTATLKQVAQAQVQEQEQQRIFGFFPNFYTSYIWDAAPMTKGLKFKLALHSTFDPVTFLTVAAVAGVEQEHNTFPGYGRGLEGYGKRYGATYADTVSGKMLGSAIFPMLLHQDPRYFYQGSGTIRSRLWYALVSAVICRGDNQRLEPNYSRILGSFTAAGLSNVYRSPQDRQASLTFRNGLIILAGGAVENVLREFLSRKLTRNVPAFANGKPIVNQPQHR